MTEIDWHNYEEDYFEQDPETEVTPGGQEKRKKEREWSTLGKTCFHIPGRGTGPGDDEGTPEEKNDNRQEKQDPRQT